MLFTLIPSSPVRNLEDSTNYEGMRPEHSVLSVLSQTPLLGRTMPRGFRSQTQNGPC